MAIVRWALLTNTIGRVISAIGELNLAVSVFVGPRIPGRPVAAPAIFATIPDGIKLDLGPVVVVREAVPNLTQCENASIRMDLGILYGQGVSIALAVPLS